MKDRSLTPMRDSNPMRFPAPQVTGKAGPVDRPRVARGPRAVRDALARLAAVASAHVVVDADLSAIAEA